MSRAGRRSPAVLIASLPALALLMLPVIGLVARAPWSTLWHDLRTPEATSALRLSMVCSLSATALCIVFGLPLAWMLARVPVPGRRFLRAVALVPLVLPPVVGGVALLLAFGRRGLAGQALDAWFGVRLPFTTAGAILAETFVAMPFLVLTVEAAFRNNDRRHEEVAGTLGASPIRVFLRVTLPATRPALLAGAALTWARALGEFGATVTFAGTSPGRTTTVPLEVYVLLESGRFETSVALSLVLLAISVAVLAALRWRDVVAP